MKKTYTLFFLTLIVHWLLLKTTQFIAWPEMLAYPYLIDKGFHFYGDIIHPYLPLLPYVLLYFFQIFGFTVSALQLITIIFVLTSDMLIFVIAKKLFSRKKALALLFTYIPLQILLEGNGLWFDHAIVPFVLGAFYFFIEFNKSKQASRIFITGLLLGIAFLIKQTTIWYLIVIFLFLVLRFKRKNASLFILAALIPLGLTFLLFDSQNVIFWGLIFPFTIMPKTAGYVLYPTVRQIIVTTVIFMPIMLLWSAPSRKTKMILLWFAASLGFLIPRFAYFHLQPVLPFFMLSLVSVGNRVIKRAHLAKWGIGIYIVGIVLISARFFVKNIGQPPRFFEPEVLVEVSQLQRIIPENESVFFYNTTANYIVAGNFIPAKPWADTFPWYLELPQMQEKIITNLQEDNVSWIVASAFANNGTYALGSYKPSLIDAHVGSSYSKVQSVGDNFTILKSNNR